jgi:hypothetical protein
MKAAIISANVLRQLAELRSRLDFHFFDTRAAHARIPLSRGYPLDLRTSHACRRRLLFQMNLNEALDLPIALVTLVDCLMLTLLT